jgi:threonine dehydrogenase-like Zn-dependent dehydrogenase
MKATLTYGVKDVRVENIADPTIIESTDAIVKVTAGGICGTDLHIYRGHFQLDEGIGVGHEFVGRIEEVGNEVKSLKKGDKVVSPFWVSCGKCYFCQIGLTTSCLNGGCFGLGGLLGDEPGCQAEYVTVPHAEGTLVKVPDSLSDDSNDEKTLFLEDNISTGYHGAVCGEIKPNDTVVVLGDGAVGLFATYSANLFDPARVITIGHHDYRLRIAEQYGADITINSNNQDIEKKIMDLTNGIGADVVIECIGTSEGLKECLQIVRPGGNVSFVGLFFEPFPLDITDFFLRNLTLRGGVAPARTYIPQLMPLVESGDLDPTLVISHRISLDEVPKGYELMNNKTQGAIKIVFNP